MCVQLKDNSILNAKVNIFIRQQFVTIGWIFKFYSITITLKFR